MNVEYVELTVEEALKICGKQAKVLVAVRNLQDSDTNSLFTPKKKNEYESLFEDVKTVSSMCDDLMRKLSCFTEKQDIYNIKPKGFEKIIILKQ